ncbi:MAG: amino acid ABC transporter substrate-binding protein [Alphaproteobacteria bacterium]|nr:amino acid ABC transporter substrate-binding protein [Alphaproteobacteria bacterium]
MTSPAMPNRVRRFLSLALAAAFVAGGISATSGVSPAAAQQKEVLLVGTSLTLAPFSFINEKGENVGYELDILKEIGVRKNYNVQFVRVPFAQNWPALNAGVFRVSASSAFMTCERMKNPTGVGEFTVATYNAGQAIATLAKNAGAIKSPADFAGKKIGVESIGTTADRVADELAKTIRFEKVVFPDNPTLFLALEQGRVDAVMQGEFSAIWQTRGNNNIVISGRLTDTYVPVGFLFKQGDPLRLEFNKVLDEMKADGTMAKIYKQWFNTEPPADSPAGKVVPPETLVSRDCT